MKSTQSKQNQTNSTRRKFVKQGSIAALGLSLSVNNVFGFFIHLSMVKRTFPGPKNYKQVRHM